MAASEEFIKTCTEQMRCKAMRSVVEEELIAHIEDQTEAYLQEGMEEEKAELMAVKQMGDPIEIGTSLDRVHRPKMDWKTFGIILALAAAGLLVQAVMNRQGIAIEQNHLSTYIKSTAVGMALMVLICYLDYTILGKYPRTIWCIMTLLGAVIGLVTPRINGTKRYGWFIMLLVVSYGGIVYYYRNQKIRGIFKALAWMAAGFGIVILCSQGAPFGGAAKLWMFGSLVMLGFAVIKGWYGTKRWVGVLLLCAPFAVCILMGICILSFGTYQADRLRAMLNPEVYNMTFGFVPMALRQAFHNLKLFGASGNPETDYLPYLAEPENYVMLWIEQNYGFAAGLFVVILLTLLAFLVVCGIRRQSNRLGMIVGVGSLFIFFVPVVVNVMMNTGYSWNTSCALPFISMNGKENVCLYILMGLLLSVFRSQTTLPEPKAKPRIRSGLLFSAAFDKIEKHVDS